MGGARRASRKPSLFPVGQTRSYSNFYRTPPAISISIEMQAVIKVESGRETLHPVIKPKATL